MSSMKVAVLPFNAAQGTPPALGRQLSNFAADTVRAATNSEINSVSFLAQMDAEDGPRAAFVNVSDTLMEWEWLDQMFSQSEVDRIMDGLLKKDGEHFTLTVRFHEKGNETPLHERTDTFTVNDLFPQLRTLISEVSQYGGVELPDNLKGDNLDFGTDNPQAFMNFLEGYDAFQYIQQAQGRVAREFNPQGSIDILLAALELDNDFVAPYETLVQLCRMLGQFRIGQFDWVEAALTKLTQFAPDDFKAYFALGEVYQGVNNLEKAVQFYEKSQQLEPNEPAILTRLGMLQMNMNMPVNAERNFRKAVELEADDKPSLDMLAGVLQQTNRGHEVPPLWKEQIDKSPQNPVFRAKYAASLIQNGNEDQGVKAFEEGLSAIEDNLVIKRFYAPYLAQKEDLDRAMDFYEDCIEVAPNDVQLLLEYAQTLQSAKRDFEIPQVLKTVLNNNPDPNTRANVLAWLTELEQPKRAEAVQQAEQKMQAGDFDGAIRDLKPLRNWLADYWKLWALLSAAYNRVGASEDAQDASIRLINLFPGCEPAYGELLQAMTMLGKHEEAYNVLRNTAINMPGSLGVHVNLALAAKRIGNVDEAKGLARQIREAVGPNKDIEDILSEVDR